MQKKVKIITIILLILIVTITSINILTKGKITGLLGLVNPMDLKSSDVPYTNNSQSTVQGAIDDLYTKANTWINPSVLNENGYYTNKARSIIATSNGILLIRNGNTHFINANNWEEEKNHIQQVFSDVFCDDLGSIEHCYASDFNCYVYDDGGVFCSDYSSGCYVPSDGSVDCN